jgi:hypothetical protein
MTPNTVQKAIGCLLVMIEENKNYFPVRGGEISFS